MIAMGIERVDYRGTTPRPTHVKVTSRLPYVLARDVNHEYTQRIQKLGSIVMSTRTSRQRAVSASSDIRENGDYQLSKQTKFLEYKNSPKMVPRQPTDLRLPGDQVKRRTLSDSSAIPTEESPSHRLGSKSGNPYKTLRPQVKEKVVRKVSFSEDLVVISDSGEIKARRSHSARHIRHLVDSEDHRSNKPCRYMHLLKGKEEASHNDDLDVVYHGLTSLLGTKPKKDSERKTSKVQSADKGGKQKVSKSLSIPGKKVKKGSAHSGSV